MVELSATAAAVGGISMYINIRTCCAVSSEMSLAQIMQTLHWPKS